MPTPAPSPAAPAPAPAAPAPAPAPTPPAAPAPAAQPPQAPAANPFAELPFPSPGDRIKSEDFRRLAQALSVLADTYRLAGASFGQPYGQVKLALAAQQYEIARVISVHGIELAGVDDASLDDRRVLYVAPLVLGDRQVAVVVTEVSETRRFMPNLVGLTYRQAATRVQEQLGDVISRGGPVTVPHLVGRTVSDAEREVSR